MSCDVMLLYRSPEFQYEFTGVNAHHFPTFYASPYTMRTAVLMLVTCISMHGCTLASDMGCMADTLAQACQSSDMMRSRLAAAPCFMLCAVYHAHSAL